MSDQENTTEIDPVEEEAKAEAEERRKVEEVAKEPLKKTASGKGRGLSLAGNRKKN